MPCSSGLKAALIAMLLSDRASVSMVSVNDLPFTARPVKALVSAAPNWRPYFVAFDNSC